MKEEKTVQKAKTSESKAVKPKKTAAKKTITAAAEKTAVKTVKSVNKTIKALEKKIKPVQPEEKAEAIETAAEEIKVVKTERKKSVMFVASEGLPFVKTGGLADVVGALPKQLAENANYDVSVIMPLYAQIDASVRARMNFVGNFNVGLAWRNQYCGLFTLREGKVTYLFIDNEYYFKRDNLYGYFDDGSVSRFSRKPCSTVWVTSVIIPTFCIATTGKPRLRLYICTRFTPVSSGSTALKPCLPFII